MDIDYRALSPELILSGTIIVVLVVDVFLSARRKWLAMPISLIGVVAALAALLSMVGGPVRTAFGGSFVVDNFTLLFQGFFLIAAIVVLAISLRYFREGGFYQGEYYFLLLTAFLGCVMMPASRDLLLLFISLELVSAPGFLMAAFRKGDIRSNEAGLKFFLIGVLSTAVMLYGMSLIYGLTGAHAARRDRGRARQGDGLEPGVARAGRDLVRGRGLRLQGERLPVPVLGPRHVRGLAGAGGRLPGGGLQRGRLRGSPAADVHRVHRTERVLGPGLRLPVDRDDDAREPRGAQADPDRAAARVLGDRAVRVHPVDVRARHERRVHRTTPRSRPPWPTS